VTVSPDSPSGSKCFDLEIEADDTAYKERVKAVITKLTSVGAVDLTAVDDEIAQGAQAVRTSNLKREFFLSLASNPQTFIQKWLTSQSKDLDLVLGNEHGVREEDLKNSDFFGQSWVEDAVSIQEGLRVAGALQKLHGV